MEETKIIIIVECKVPLTEWDVQWIKRETQHRLMAGLVQKSASIIFEREYDGQAATETK